MIVQMIMRVVMCVFLLSVFLCVFMFYLFYLSALSVIVLYSMGLVLPETNTTTTTMMMMCMRITNGICCTRKIDITIVKFDII